MLSKQAIERLAEADEYEVVREVQVRNSSDAVQEILISNQEYFADFAPLLPSLFSLNHNPTAKEPLYGPNPNTWHEEALERSVQGIIAVLLSLKKKPVIRYERMSSMAKKLGVEIQASFQGTIGDARGSKRLLEQNPTRVESIRLPALATPSSSLDSGPAK